MCVCVGECLSVCLSVCLFLCPGKNVNTARLRDSQAEWSNASSASPVQRWRSSCNVKFYANLIFAPLPMFSAVDGGWLWLIVRSWGPVEPGPHVQTLQRCRCCRPGAFSAIRCGTAFGRLAATACLSCTRNRSKMKNRNSAVEIGVLLWKELTEPNGTIIVSCTLYCAIRTFLYVSYLTWIIVLNT